MNQYIDGLETTAGLVQHGFKKVAVQWLNEALCPALRDSVLADSFVLRNRQLRLAAAR